MTKNDFLDVIDECKENKWDLCVAVTVPGQKSPEYIINKRESIDNKVKYYLQAYNDNMELIANPEIKMVRAFGCDYYVVE